MTSIALTAVTAGLIAAPLLLLAAVTDRLLSTRSPGLRRRLWQVVLVGALASSVGVAVGARAATAGDAYWARTSAEVVPADPGPIVRGGNLVRATLPRMLEPASGPDDPARRPTATAVYLAVVALLVVRRVVVDGRVRRYLRRADRIDDVAIRDAAQRIGRTLGLRRTPELRWHPDAGGSPRAPALAGVFRATVLLPREARGWEPAQTESVLFHELAHARQRDNLWQRVGWFHAALQWFNPLAWYALARLRDASEMAADEAAATRVGRDDYAAALVEVTRSLVRPALAIPSMAASSLPRRVGRLLVEPRAVAPRTSAVALGSIAAAAVTVATAGWLVHATPAVLDGWTPQQFRWESATTANGLFLHGSVDLAPGRLAIGDDGLLVAVHEADGKLRTCMAWRPQGGPRFECDHVPVGDDPRAWLEARLFEAAAQWEFDPTSPLATFRTAGDDHDDDGFAGSRITGLPGRSRNPGRAIEQRGWIDGDGARIGVFTRGSAFAVAFRYAPRTRTLRVYRHLGAGRVEAWDGAGWRPAGEIERRRFRDWRLAVPDA